MSDAPGLDDLLESPRRTSPRAALLMPAILCAGFILSEKFGAYLQMDLREAIDSLQLYRFVTYAWVFDAERGAGFNLVYWLAVVLLSWGFCRDAVESIGAVRTWILFALLPAVGGAATAAWQTATGAVEPVTGDTMPGLAAVVLAAAIVEPARRVRHLLFLPTRRMTAALLTIALPFAYAIGVHRAPTAVLPLAVTLAATIAACRARPAFEAGSRWLAARLERAREDRDVELRREVDAILEKIHQTGMESLTRVERRTLQKASRLFQETRNEKP